MDRAGDELLARAGLSLDEDRERESATCLICWTIFSICHSGPSTTAAALDHLVRLAQLARAFLDDRLEVVEVAFQGRLTVP